MLRRDSAKALLFAMKLAEYELLKKTKGFAPIILLDDVFEKLDAQRMHQLLERVCVPGNGQLFITDTHATGYGNIWKNCRLIMPYRL